MGAAPKRITNGQRAAVCALRLAGVRIDTACSIVDAGYRAMKDHLGPDWFERTVPRRKWRGRVLERLRRDYCDHRIPIDTVVERFGTTRDMLRLLAIEHGWPRRDRPRDKRRLSDRWKYRLVRECTGSRELALAAVAATI